MATTAINSFPGMPRQEDPSTPNRHEMHCQFMPDDAFRIIRRMASIEPLTLYVPKAQSIGERQSSIKLLIYRDDPKSGMTIVLKRDGTWALLTNITV